MFGNDKAVAALAIAGGLVALAALAGGKKEPSVASKSAAAFREAAATPPSPGQPARTLRPDALDAPAATSVQEAQRSAEMAEEMTGHGGHGAGAYRQVDAGRGPGAHEGSEPQAPGAGAHQGHEHAGEAAEAAAVYVCPMHPEVTSNGPGRCPKCGMALVERRKE